MNQHPIAAASALSAEQLVALLVELGALRAEAMALGACDHGADGATTLEARLAATATELQRWLEQLEGASRRPEAQERAPEAPQPALGWSFLAAERRRDTLADARRDLAEVEATLARSREAVAHSRRALAAVEAAERRLEGELSQLAFELQAADPLALGEEELGLHRELVAQQERRERCEGERLQAWHEQLRQRVGEEAWQRLERGELLAQLPTALAELRTLAALPLSSLSELLRGLREADQRLEGVRGAEAELRALRRPAAEALGRAEERRWLHGEAVGAERMAPIVETEVELLARRHELLEDELAQPRRGVRIPEQAALIADHWRAGEASAQQLWLRLAEPWIAALEDEVDSLQRELDEGGTGPLGSSTGGAS